MSAQKFHIGKNGPAPCHARVRACEFDVNGTQQEVNQIWEKQQEALFEDSMLSGVSKSAVKATPEIDSTSNGAAEHENPSIMNATRTLSSKEKYAPAAEDVKYEESEKDVAMKLALANLTSLSYTPIQSRDLEWETNGFSDVERYTLEDGSVGYFKPFGANSYNEDTFEEYGTTSLGASINEVNSYRMAKALGGKYTDLVPETVIREVNGSLGTLQREVVENDMGVNYDDNPGLKEDYRRAAIFDFVVGNLDRHTGNYLYGVEGEGANKRPCIRLIDNSFSFPLSADAAHVNSSIFADNHGPHGRYGPANSYKIPNSQTWLNEEEIDSLTDARESVEEWINAKTIDKTRGKKTLQRIDYLLETEEISSFSEYYYM